MDELLRIKNESLRDGKGVIVHVDDFNWMIKTIEIQQKSIAEQQRIIKSYLNK